MNLEFRMPFFLQEHDRRFRRKQQLFFQRRDSTGGFHALHRREHQRKRFFFAVFALTQKLNGLFVARVGEQMKSTNAFDGDNISSADGVGSSEQGIVILECAGISALGQLR